MTQTECPHGLERGFCDHCALERETRAAKESNVLRGIKETVEGWRRGRFEAEDALTDIEADLERLAKGG